jgi:hypothetical protein
MEMPDLYTKKFNELQMLQSKQVQPNEKLKNTTES